MESLRARACVCVCVCVYERERERQVTAQCRVTHHVCMLVCVREGDMVTSQPRLVCKHIWASSLSVTRLYYTRAWMMVKLRTFNLSYIYFERWSSRLWKGALNFSLVLVVLANHGQFWPHWLANVSVGQSEQTVFVGRRDFSVAKRSVWERRGIEDLQ